MQNRPVVVDALLAAGLSLVSVFQGLDDSSGQWREYDAVGIALTVLATAPVVARRRQPVVVFGVCCGFLLAQVVLGYNPVISTYGVLLALYTVAATRPRSQIVACVLVVFVLWLYAGTSAGSSVLGVALQGLVIPAVVWRMGDGARRLAEANAQLRRDRAEQARRAVVDERVRIARELHDVVAHHVSVIAIQAALARYVLRSDPATADGALDTVLGTSGETMDEMRRLLALLRADGPDGEPASYDPAPGLDALPDLAGRVRAAGVPVEVRVTGTPQPLSPGAELCAYRVIQESLTNVIKHASPASATVDLEYRPHELVAVIRDDGARAARASADSRPGQGLMGMRERALLYGGTLDAGPRAGRGFEVRLTLPRDHGEGRS